MTLINNKAQQVNNKTQQGVSLIEILVTTLILGIGLLGVASLQISSVSSNQEGFFTSQATSIAEELSSRIRSSKVTIMMPDSGINYIDYLNNYTSVAGYTCAASPTMYCRANLGSPPDAQCSDRVNDLLDITTFDKWDICKIAENTLPAGKVRVIRSGWRLSVVVEWDPVRARDDFGQKKIVNASCNAIIANPDKNCVVLEILP